MGASGVKQISFLPQRQQRKIKQSSQIVTVELVLGRSWEVKMVTDKNGHINWDLVASNGFDINVVELSVTIYNIAKSYLYYFKTTLVFINLHF